MIVSVLYRVKNKVIDDNFTHVTSVSWYNGCCQIFKSSGLYRSFKIEDLLKVYVF